MRIRKEEKTTVIQGTLGLLAMLCVVYFSSTMAFPVISASVRQAMYLLAGLMYGAVAFAVFAQGWMLFTDKLSRQRLYSAVLFFIVGTLDILHIAAFTGISAFGFIPGYTISAWFILLSHLVGAAGMLIIFSVPDKQVSARHKAAAFSGSAIVLFIVIMLLYKYQHQLPHLLGPQALGSTKQAMWIGIPFLYALGIFAILYRHRQERPPAALTVVCALLFMMIGHILITAADPFGIGIAHVAGEWFMGISYYYVLKGVYRLTIEEPFRGQQLAEAQMMHMAYHDDLTNLPNLRRLKEQLAIHLAPEGKAGLCTGVAVMNINRFKAINDSFGYRAGDKLLTEVGERLSRRCLPEEGVYRMSEDEFAVIIPEYSDPRAIEIRALQLLKSIHPLVTIEETEYHISLSMGLSIYPKDGNSGDQIIQNADMAVHNGKEQGLEFVRYTAAIKNQTHSRIELENDMRKGLERGEFFLEFQPQVSLNSGRVVGVEALVRWSHPRKGLLSPGEFIPVAEDSGLIVPLGEWVLRTACGINKKWQDEGYDPVCISVNLSMRQFRQHNLVDKIDGILREVGLEAQYLELEVTESMTFDIDIAFEQLQRLKRLGVHISIDDFGTGYSSLYYLKMLPIDRLKIDRSFVKEVMLDGNGAAIVSTITMMAHHLKLRVTAEGVENEEQLEFLKLQNCHEGQGYLFSKPVPAGLFERRFLTRMALSLQAP
ncbi:putative bifunctional diguanylate cyclase/phosphodiesterase [Paenibacillus bouchesdurhonensis]|uniref:putative bifunctional diguanylate cyclase/phosphodiesterase n=1 Tax=Paenibacillus bouchesdurhonensis TaxID=1870990 RepID=UPI000DA5F2C8|nr:EAL domain-containing protein [Paenibacillus bouchesdurhonensis]